VPPISDAQLAPEVGAFLARALEKRRQDRYQSAAEMIAALDATAEAQKAFAVHTLADSAPIKGAPAQRQPRTLPLDLSSRPPAADVASSPIAESRPWRRSVLLGAAVAVGALAVLFAVTRGGGPHGPLPIRPSLLPVLPLVVPARKLLGAGDPAGAAALLEPAVAGPLAGEPSAWLALGEARAKLGKDGDALAAFERAVALGGSDDPALRAFIEDAVKSRPRLALQALELLPHMGRAGAELLADQASRGKAAPVRARARELAATGGIPDVDLVSSFSLDLDHGASCKDRKEAVARLRGLRDKRAIPALRRARGRRGGFLHLEDVNGCLDRDAAEAVDFLSALP